MSHHDDKYLDEVIKEIDDNRRVTTPVDTERRRAAAQLPPMPNKPTGYFKLPPHLISDSAAITESEPVTDPYFYYVELGNWLRMKDPRIETMCVMLLNSQNQKLGIELVASGTPKGIHAHPRQVFDIALDPKYRASGIILAHNHPSGNAAPSDEDKTFLRIIATIGKPLECALKDFIIVGAIDFYSHKNSTLEL